MGTLHADALWAGIAHDITTCRKCPRLAAWIETTAREKRAAYANETYWARPVPGFGDPCARLLVVGLAPGAHGANRTGRMFTGDRSGLWLFRALHRAGFANQASFERSGDGLRLLDAYVTAVVRCAPPANRPNRVERDTCLPYLVREMELLPGIRVILALGAFAWNGTLKALEARASTPRPRPKFGHGAEVRVGPYLLLGSFHPSQQNTFTGKLTEPMFDEVFSRARRRLSTPDPGPRP